ncbi:hypothetical protein OAC87_04065 [Pseudomonadales bacterium]|jgi:hypothetical protein|nr:hypothetical protein [Pseudomonadales bacterium]|tara:strand:- start:780 stop:1133 length:354 start_codon:yes stop_codon:yes gene_type:complete
MATIVTRSGKGSPLTNGEVDANFNNLNSDKVETSTISGFGATLIDDANATAARSTLGVGTIAVQAANNVDIDGGSITGITDLAVADGGTGASSISAAQTNLQVDPAGTAVALAIALG